MKLYLIVAKGSKKGMPIPITADLFLIGADRICQLRKASLGAKHCAVVIRARKVFVRDMDSGLPTVINGEAMHAGDECPVQAGDRIEVGPLEFMVQYREQPLSQRDLEEWAASCLDVDRVNEIDDEDDEYYTPPTTATGAAQAIIDRLQAQKGLVKGRLRIGREADVTVVRVNVRTLVEEAEVTQLRKELCDSLNRSNLRVLLDLKNVKRMSTAGVMMLIEFNRWLKPWGNTLALCRIRPDLLKMLGTLHDEQIRTFPDRDTAIATNPW